MTMLTPRLLLRAYRAGIFPMGHEGPAEEQIHWYAPDPRGILPLDDFHVPSTLAQQVRQERFKVVSDRDFATVIRACANRERTWITPEIRRAYIELHEAGFAHSVECWQEGTLVGGLYGVAIGGAFFGESMFYRARNASKIALVHLVRQMRRGGFVLLDTQYKTEHLDQFGATEISRAEYERRLAEALAVDATWWPASAGE